MFFKSQVTFFLLLYKDETVKILRRLLEKKEGDSFFVFFF